MFPSLVPRSNPPPTPASVLQRLDTSSEGKRNDRYTIHLQFHNGMGQLLAIPENDGQQMMLPTWGYLPLWSKDKLTLVQIFTDSATEEIVKVTVATRRAPWMTFASITEVEKVD